MQDLINGVAPTAYTLKAKLQALGIRTSHSRPGFSDDNAHIEAWFRTTKSDSATRSRASLTSNPRAWALKLATWYNGEHRHSAIGFVTPGQRHAGDATALLGARKRVRGRTRAQSAPIVSRYAPLD